MSAHRPDKNLAILALLVGMGLIVWGTLASHLQPVPCWLLLLALIILFLGAIGNALTGRWSGVLIDGRNKMSLSRLQMTLWTLLIFSALMAVVLLNLCKGDPQPLAVSLPPALWVAMGISAASFAGTSLILTGKTQQDPNPVQLRQTTAALQASGNSSVTNTGQLLHNTSKDDAELADIFRGDEVGNGASVDLSKIQMFFLTLILILTYALAIGKQLLALKATGLHAFPDLDESMIALLGVSHSGYLAYKAAPHTSTANAAPGVAPANGSDIRQLAIVGGAAGAAARPDFDRTLPPLDLKEAVGDIATQPYPDSPGEDMSSGK